MAGKWWESAPVVTDEPQTAPQGRGGVFIPDQGAIDDARRADTSLGYQGEGNARDATRLSNEVETRARQGMGDIRKEFTALPEVKKYGTVVQQADTILHTRPDAAGDQDLIYAIAQLRDPLGSVREGDAATIEGGQAAIERTVQQLKKQLGQGGTFSDEYRQQLRREAISRLNTANRAYSQARNQYAEIAQASGFDPKLVIGPHAGAAYYDRFKAYDEANGLGRQDRREQPSDPRSPFLGMNPEDLSFEDVQGTGAFGPSDGRLNPAQQSALDAFLKANAGNPNFGPEQLGNFYKSIGVEVGSVPASPAFFDAVRKGEPFDTTPDPTAADAARKKWAEDQVRAEMQAMGMDTINSSPLSDKGFTGGFSDELNGVRDGIRNLFTGGSFVRGYRDGRDITRAAQDMSREQNGVGPEIISSLMTPAGLVSRANMARDAMAMGALTGIGEGDGFADTVSKAVTGGALGYGAGKLVEKVAPAIADSALAKKASEYFGGGRAQKAQDFTEAAKRQDLDYMLADVPGTYKAKMATGMAGMTLGGVPLKVAAGKIVEKAKAAKDRIAGNVGNAGDNVATGQSAQKGMEAWERQTEGRGAQLFDAIPIKGDSPVDLATTKQTLSDINGELSSNPELAALVRDPKLASYQKALESGGLSWDDTKAFRSRIGKIIGKPSLTSDGASDDAMRALYASLSQDIERAAAAHSPEAAKAFSRANNYWRGRQTRIDDVMSKIVGKDRNLSAEQTTAQLERWAQAKGGDFNKLARAVRSLPEDEANNVRAYFIDRMGMASKGNQDAAGEVFSPDTWLTSWNSLSPRAKAILFQGEHRKALDDLATVFSGMKASKVFANPSGTGYSVWGAANASMATANPLAFALSAIGQVGAGATLASPRVARWLVALSKKPNPSAQLAHIGQLTAIARAEPVIANDIFSLQQRLAAEFQKSPGALAAQDTGDGRREPPAQGERNDAQ